MFIIIIHRHRVNNKPYTTRAVRRKRAFALFFYAGIGNSRTDRLSEGLLGKKRTVDISNTRGGRGYPRLNRVDYIFSERSDLSRMT